MAEAVESAVGRAVGVARERFGLELPTPASEMLGRFAAELLRWNRTFNLTSITEPEQVAELHVLDSLAIVRHVPTGSRVLDVGTGGGLPGIPLAIARPDCELWLADRTEKKIVFLKNVIARLGLRNVSAVHVRLAGDPAGEGLPEVDVAVSRAFTAVPEWVRLARPYVVKGGRIVAMLGAEEPNLEELEGALEGDRVILHERYVLPSGAKRAILVVEKA